MHPEIPQQMLAAINREYGPAESVKIETIPTPKLKPNFILIRVRASTVSTGDWRLRSLQVPKGFGVIMKMIFGFKRPRYGPLGTDLSGEVVAVGDKVTKFKVGDKVVAHQGIRLGGHAQYCALPENCAVVQMPGGLSYEGAASLCFGGMTALSFLRDKAKIKNGEKLLVIGAGGAVGSAAVQLGKFFGATVTGVTSTSKIETILKLGADNIIDYTQTNWLTQPGTYDVIFDTIGSINFQGCKHKLSATGRLLLAVADLPATLSSMMVSIFNKKKVFAGSVTEKAEDLKFLTDLAANGKMVPLIGHKFSLQKIVEAHRVVESGHKTGSVVIEISKE